MQRYKILWADDEIDYLTPYIKYLDAKGYDVTPVPSGADVFDEIEKADYDIVFLDEMMPGMTGLETLAQLKQIRPNLPAVMITRSEEEHIMEDAIGSKIADYLIKPLNPNQILMSVKKILENKRLVSEKTNLGYQQNFRAISMQYQDRINHSEWAEIYKKLIFWELELDKAQDKSMEEVFEMQKSEANSNFTKFIEEEYEGWMSDPDADRPVMSHHLLKKKVLPLVKQNSPLYFVMIDNLRYDQWKVMQEVINDYFRTIEEDSYYSILPTATSYARNAVFSGMSPADMAKYHPDIWVDDAGENEEALNKHEEEFLRRFLKKHSKATTCSYHKILNNQHGKNLLDNFSNLQNYDLNAVVFNFVDMLSHARTDMQMIKELAPDESAYRSLTKSWLQHSSLLDFLKKVADVKGRVVITTDHGMIRVRNPKRIIGDRNVNTNLRFKLGKNLNLDDKKNGVIEVRNPENYGLPKPNVSTSYFFTTDDFFFAYPNNYNYYANYYKDTFQHGGVSLEEMIIPFVYLEAR